MSNEPKKKARGLRIGLITGIITAMLVWNVVVPYYPTSNDNGPQMSWRTIWEGPINALAENGTIAAGVGGILEVYFSNVSVSPNLSYVQNTSATIEAWCRANMPGFEPYANASWFNIEIPHSVYFMIVVRVRANKTMCANSTEVYGVYNQDRLRVNISCGDLGITTLTPMVQVNTSNLSVNPFCWSNFWINWTGTNDWTETGYVLAANNVTQLPTIKFEAFY